MACVVQPRNTPMRNDRPWIYCGRCGLAMGWEQHGMAFNRETGKKVLVIWWTCPSWRPPGDIDPHASKHDRANQTDERPLAR
jgi:hypothetical protein